MSDVESVTLPDGRRVAYAEYGDPSGRLVLLCHGFPGSRVGGRLLDDAAGARGVRLVAPDRPGVGDSDPRPGRRIVDWADDAAALADALDVAAVGVVGVSAGAPYAAACAARVPERLAGCVLVSGVPHPTVRPRSPLATGLGRVYARAPWLARPPLRVAGRLAERAPGLLLAVARRGLSPPDRALLDDPTVAGALREGVATALRNGTGGPARDGALLGTRRGWGFDPADLRTRVTLHHGAADRSVPPDGARAMAAAVPDASLTVHAGEGHLSAVRAAAPAILDAALGA